MASICGIYNFERGLTVARSDLEHMLDAMKHRGGNRRKVFLEDNIGMACTYPDSSYFDDVEPLSVGNSKIFCVAEGSFINYDSLVDELETDPLKFQKYHLVELIMALYESKGLSFLAQVNGGFCLALWDQRNRQLVLARDRFGVKPVYYFVHSTGVIFATEIKGIIAILKEKPGVNFAVLHEYLVFRYVAGASTMFEGVRELQPASYVLWSGDEKFERKYWSVEDAHDEDKANEVYSDLDSLDILFKNAVKKRIRFSDRIGANCSGGIDSGLVTAVLGSYVKETLDTFTVGFHEKEWDERCYAALTARKYETNYHELVIESNNFFSQLGKLNWCNDEPLSDPNSVLLYLLARYSKQIIDLLFTGEGADEVFLGYPRYNLLNIYQLCHPCPAFIRSSFSHLMSLFDSRRLRKLTGILKKDKSYAIIHNSAFVPYQSIENIIRPDLICSPFSFRQETLGDLNNKDLLSRAMIYEIKTYLVSSLNRLDKMNMAVGLETATPFLDNTFFEYALKIPKDQKIRLLNNKYILRKLAFKYLPFENLKMPKSGFGVPIAIWFRTNEDIKEILQEMQSDSFICQIFEKKELTQLIHQHMMYEDRDFSEILWLTTNFYIWHQQFFQ